MTAGVTSQKIESPIVPFEKLRDVIGPLVARENIQLVPVLGDFDFCDDAVYLEDVPGSEVIPSFIDEYDWDDLNCWWTRSRLLAIFGIDHPVGGNLTRVLDFVMMAILSTESGLVARPVLLRSRCRDQWAPFSVALSFDNMASDTERQLIANVIWNLLMEQPKELGVFSDYIAIGWHDCSQDVDRSTEGAFYRVSCDGITFSVDYIGELSPDYTPQELEGFDRSEFWGVTYPFEIPRKIRRNHGMHTKHSVVRF